MKSMTLPALVLAMAASFSPTLLAEERPADPQTRSFEVSDIPKPAPIEGQLGEPGAPSLMDSQEKLAKAMLEKGICNVSFYGEDFCKNQQAKTFRVTDQFGASTVKIKEQSQE